ncbi:MAG: MarR family transcriptional regulator [Brevefilum sp.]|nr:MarR family transcriptional regulator [Brevefilum sp.]
MIRQENGCNLYYSLKSIFLHIDNREKMLLAHFNLSIPRFYILMHIHDHPGINYNDLSNLLLCTKSNTSRVVSAMQRDGLVKRNVNPDDRRSFHLDLTERGNNLFKEVYSTYQEHIKQLLAKFSEDQLQAYTMVSAHIEELVEPDLNKGIDLQRRSELIDVKT